MKNAKNLCLTLFVIFQLHKNLMEMLASGKLNMEMGKCSILRRKYIFIRGPFLIAVLVYRSVMIYVMNCSWTIHLRLNDLKQQMHSSLR